MFNFTQRPLAFYFLHLWYKMMSIPFSNIKVSLVLGIVGEAQSFMGKVQGIMMGGLGMVEND